MWTYKVVVEFGRISTCRRELLKGGSLALYGSVAMLVDALLDGQAIVLFDSVVVQLGCHERTEGSRHYLAQRRVDVHCLDERFRALFISAHDVHYLLNEN